jgi:hypothetical protein
MVMVRTILTSLLVGGLTLTAVDVEAQQPKKARVRPTGFRAILGVAVPDDADSGFLVGGAVNLGTVVRPWVHLSAGATRWSSDLDASSFGGRDGTLRDLRVYTNVGVEFWELSGVQGFFDVGIAAHFLDASVADDPDLADAIGGTNFGGEVTYGLASTAGAFRVSAEIRREFVDDASNWSFALGVGTRFDKHRKTGTTTR